MKAKACIRRLTVYRLAVRSVIVLLLFATAAGTLPATSGTAEASAWDPSNLMGNPGFELAANGFPTGWSKTIFTGTPEIGTDTNTAHDGSSSLRISAASGARGSAGRSTTVSENVYYDLSAWVKTDNIVSSDLGTTIRIQYFNSKGEKVGGNYNVGNWKGTNNWMKVSYRFQVPAGASRVLVENFIWNATGTVWFDDMRLEESLYLTGMIRQEHPRLLAYASDFTKINQKIAADSTMSGWFQNVKSSADKTLNEAVSKYEKPDGIRLLDVSRKVLQRTYALGMAYRLTGNAAYAERLWSELQAAAAFPDWNPSHFLDTAEMTHAFAIGYDWLHDYWSEARKQTLRDAIVQKGLTPGLNEYKTAGWPKAINNWNLVCNGGLAMGALAIGDEPAYRFIAQDILRQGLDSMQISLAQYAPDGGWYEGYGYWDYATQYLTAHLAGMQSALGTDFGLTQAEGLADTGLYPIYLEGPLKQTFNFADSGTGQALAPHLIWLAGQFNRPELSWFRKTNSGSAQSLLWYEPGAYPGPKAANMPRDKYFRKVEVASMRSDWEDSKALFAGFKGAFADPNHKHLDAGSFVLDAMGVRWAQQLGADNYNLPGYFSTSGQRWTYYRNRAEGSNTLVINPGAGPEQNYDKAASITAFGSEAREAYAIADMKPLYNGATKAQRGVKLLDHRRAFLVQDEVETQASADIWWFMHTATAVQDISADGKTAVLIKDGKRLWMRILTPQGGFTLMDPVPLPQSPAPSGQNANTGVKKLAIHMPGVQQMQLAVLMVPLRDFEQPPSTLPAVVPLASWSVPNEPPSLLGGITVNGDAVPGFAGTTFTYDVTAAGTAAPTVTAAAANPNATVTISPVPDVSGTVWIDVKNPGAALTTRYAVQLRLKKPSDDTLPVVAITASADDGNVPANTYDNDFDTRWSADGSGQWIQYDLGSATAIRSVSTAWYKGNERRAFYDIEVSADGTVWSNVYSGSSSGKTLEMENVDIGETNARYVRIVGHGNTANTFNSITEARIYDRVNPTMEPSARLQSVSIDAGSAAVNVGSTLQLSAAGTMSDGSPADLSSAQIEYYSDNPGIISVSSTGVASAVYEGAADITVMVTKDRIVKSSRVTVTAKDRTKLTLLPVQDSYVRDGTYAGNNYGKDGSVAIKSSSANFNRIAYMQFDLSSVPANFTSVTLNVYGAVGDTGGTEVDTYVHGVADDSWTETGLTWNNKPASGSAVAMERFDSVAKWHAIDVTDYVRGQLTGDGIASLSLQQTGSGLSLTLNSKDNSKNKPYLLFRIPE